MTQEKEEVYLKPRKQAQEGSQRAEQRRAKKGQRPKAAKKYNFPFHIVDSLGQ